MHGEADAPPPLRRRPAAPTSVTAPSALVLIAAGLVTSALGLAFATSAGPATRQGAAGSAILGDRGDLARAIGPFARRALRPLPAAALGVAFATGALALGVHPAPALALGVGLLGLAAVVAR